tara:strand:+ start:27216 stop:27449 length:234 start_codon:yes stop_codon:yes gene_type:complete
MDNLIYKIALIIALISFILNLLFQISIFEGLIRSLVVYIGVLFIFFVAGLFIKWGIHLFTPETESGGDEEQSLEQST